MIDLAIHHLAGALNQALRRTLRVTDDLVVAAPLLEPDGSAATQAANKLLVFLVNTERETVAYNPGQRAESSAARIAATTSPIHLNLLVMFAANFGAANYLEALKLISFTAAYFQAHSLIDHHNSPELDERIQKLVLEVEDLSISDLSNLWGVLSGRYVPSILYRIRMVSIGGVQLIAQQDRIAQPQASAGTR